MRRHRSGVATTITLLLAFAYAAPADAGVFTPSSQLREVRSDTVAETVGFTCLNEFTRPDCPELIFGLYPSDVKTSPSFAPFVQAATTPGGTTTQDSIIEGSRLRAEGSALATGSAVVEPTPPGYIFVLGTVNGTTRDDYEVTVVLDEATEFVFEASGRIDYPSPSIPASWDARFDITLTGPSGIVASLSAVPDYACPDFDPGTYYCWVEPPPLQVSGTLPAGEYTIDVMLTTAAYGAWTLSSGAFGTSATGTYSIDLRLIPTPLPLLGPIAQGLLLGTLVAAGVGRLNRTAR